MTTPSTATVTITGYIYDNDGNPLVGATVAEQPVDINAQGNSLIGNNPVVVQTDANGFFSLTCVGGLVGKIVVPDIGAVLQGTLPASGTITLENLFAQNPNVVISGFPPQGNLNMGGYTFINLAGASEVGEPSVYGEGLSNATVFTDSGSYSPPANATIVHVRAFGGGGGGGGGRASASDGGGGGGGPEVVDVDLLPVNGLLTIAIGPGGAGGAVAGAGTDGTATTIVQAEGGVTVTAAGGSGGAQGTGGGPGTGGAGGTGGTYLAGAGYLINEQDGAAGSNGTTGAGGAGAGDSQIGGLGGNPNAAGSAGANGLVIVWSN